MRRSTVAGLVLSGVLPVLQVAVAAGPDGALPLTVDERNAACSQAEDADPERAIALAQSVLDEGAVLGAMQRADALGCRGWAQAWLARKDEARRDAYALRELVQGLERGAERVRLTRRAGGILHRSGDRVGALDLYARAVGDAEAQGLESERIPLLANLGVLHSEFEEHARAQVNYEQALALMERLGDFRYEAPVRYNLGLNLTGQDRDADAVPHLRRALELIRDTGMGGPMQELGASIALAGALQQTGQTVEAQALLERARAIDMPAPDPSMELQLRLIEAGQRADAGDVAGALALIDAVEPGPLTEIQQWDWLKRRADLLERLGRHADANRVLHAINTLRETYLRHQNHERLAALDAHMRDREQRLEVERLQAAADTQARRLEVRDRLQGATAVVAGLLLLFGGAVLLWQRRMNRRLFLASHTDALTGLSNRRAMTQRLRALALQPQGDTALLLIDLDLFKRINDEYGHDVGDQVLVACARRLQGDAGADAIVSRWGGEEFIVLLPHCDAQRARAAADRLRTVLAQPVPTDKGPVQTGASLGYANLPLPGPCHPDAWHASLQLADSALYLAKRAGRDAWAGYWIEHAIADWPAERLGREAHLARSLRVIEPQSSRPLREAVTLVAPHGAPSPG
ncbi:tetratricopeptide repeat-containing diguanylate cyclase [Chiayiivirga flava]|uniref:diguanylate cyclase n=1 Tax=Chiayiivirga flava TaxID=659595 RepID=A0A7W8G123_9GAMM|nr:tetratricopeptide repeat-containing diguanylate cyclase [Chiayiivirga flava]MBB5208388.1 diguanylate cyclase (GGDEF)-like protein [Chiayiivirga flava]